MKNVFHKKFVQSSIEKKSQLNKNNYYKNNYQRTQNTKKGTNKGSNSSASQEINDWISVNKDNNVKIISHNTDTNIIMMSMMYGKNHIIEIIYPEEYPEVKRGFGCREISIPGIIPLSFISKANEQFDNKNLSITRVITHLATTFLKYKQSKQTETDNNTGHVIFSANASVDLNAWDITNDDNETEMVNLDPEEIISSNNNSKEEIIVSETSILNESVQISDPLCSRFDNRDDENKLIVSSLTKDNTDVIDIINNQLNLAHQLTIKNEADRHRMNLSSDIKLINKILENHNCTKNLAIQNNDDLSEINSSITNADDKKIIIYQNMDTNWISNDQTKAKEAFDTNEIFDTKNEKERFDNKIINEMVEYQILDKKWTSNDQTKEIFETKNEDNEHIKKEIYERFDNKIINEMINDQILDKKWILNDQTKEIFGGQILDDRSYIDTEEIFGLVSEHIIKKNSPTKIFSNQAKYNPPYIEEIFDLEHECIIKKNPVVEEIFDLESENILKNDPVEEIINNNQVEDNRPYIEEIFDLESEHIIKKDPTKIKRDIVKIEQDPTKIKNDPQYNNSIMHENQFDKYFDNFFTENIKMLQIENPFIEGDRVMNIIQFRWKEFINQNIKYTDSETFNNETSVNINSEIFNNETSININSDKFINETSININSDKFITDPPINIKSDKFIIDPPINIKSDDTIKTVSGQQSLKFPGKKYNEISFADVEDVMGLYLDLSEYTKNTSLPYDMEKLYINAQDLHKKMHFHNSFKTIKSFSYNAAIRVIMNELKYLCCLGLKNKFSVSPINENIYHLRFTFTKDYFDASSKIYIDNKNNKCIEIEILIDSKFYPFYPPKVRLISPRFCNNLNYRIAMMECLLANNWDSSFNIETIITQFKKITENYGEIDLDTGKCYCDLENDLIDLSLLSEIPARADKFIPKKELQNLNNDVSNINVIKNENKTGKQNTNGTGYGYVGSKQWDMASIIKIKTKKIKRLECCVKNIIKHLTKIIINNVDIDVVKIIKDSCYVPYIKHMFAGNNLFELLKNSAHFELILDSLRIMPDKFMSIFLIIDGENEKSLLEYFSEINNDCQLYLTINSETDNEYNIILNFTKFFKKVTKKTTQPQDENPKNITRHDKTVYEVYKFALTGETCQQFEGMNINAFDSFTRQNGQNMSHNKTNFATTYSVRQISKELSSHSKNLPIDFGSSIFYRYCPNNIRYHEFIITGPENTPYDSGCFHFRMYCPDDYPNKCPMVNICNTGNGTVRFNPNLYKNGLVCLSILGTWSGDRSESWIPGTSTMMQIMISIQSLVLVSEPFYNEPGYSAGSNKEVSQRYNYKIQLNCMKWAMLDILKNPIKGFENAIKVHFKLKTPYIKEICNKWIDQAPLGMRTNFRATYIDLCSELDKLSDINTDILTSKPIKNIVVNPNKG